MLSAGKKIGPYEIVRPIGAGGMGEVYCAKDPRLSRQVAIKLLPSGFSEDPDLLRRFRKEAEAVGSLNHPNILTVHDVGVQDGIPYLVTELLQGETLRSRLVRGALDSSKVTDFSLQFANALAAAHEKEIIHRDLKPENLFITKDGRLKILDFGLAKLTEKPMNETEITNTPTASALTEPGIVLGTIAYMSPEQVKAAPIDHRSDIFSFGSILYEMVTGSRPFKQGSKVETMHAILNDQPAFSSELEQNLPGLVRIIKRCLEKESDHRFQSAMDIAFALEAISESKTISKVPKRKKSIQYGALVFGLLILGIATIFLFLQKQKSQERVSEKQTPMVIETRQLTSEDGEEYWPSFSPDGKFLAYASGASGNWDIYLKRVGGEKTMNLTEDTEADDFEPAFSPDGNYIAFQSDRDGGGIYIMGATGEFVHRLTKFGHDPSWSPEGKIILFNLKQGSLFPYVMGPNELWSVNVQTGQSRLIAQEDFRQPRFSPHGERIACRYGTLSRNDIQTTDLFGKNAIPITNDNYLDWNPVWSPDGAYLYFSSDRGGSRNIWRVPIEEQTGKVHGNPERVTSGTGTSPQQLTFSSDGKHLAYSSTIISYNIHKVTFDPVTEKIAGGPTPVTTKGGVYHSISPNGQWLVFDHVSHSKPEARVISVMKVDGTGLRQLTDTPFRDRYPRWSPDGRRIAFRSNRSGSFEIWSMNAEGNDLKQLTYPAGQPMVGLPVWSPDSKKIACSLQGMPTRIFNSDKSWKEEAAEELPLYDQSGQTFFDPYSWSKDGRYLAGQWSSLKGTSHGLVIYSFETGKYIKLEDGWRCPVWFSDSHRFLATKTSADPVILSVFDAVSLKHQEIFSAKSLGIFPDFIVTESPVISPDDRTIYFARGRMESDIWMITINGSH